MGKWTSIGATVFELNAGGFNRWSMNVQEGFDDAGLRIGEAERESIATMAAAAPDLAEALKTIVQALGEPQMNEWHIEPVHADDVAAARAALAKALGGAA